MVIDEGIYGKIVALDPPNRMNLPSREKQIRAGARRTAGARFRIEALLLVLALAGVQAGIFFLASSRGLYAFALTPAAADLQTLDSGALATDNRTLFLPGSSGPPAVGRLSGFRPEPGAGYLLSLTAEAGSEFEVQILDGDSQTPTRNWRVPRGEASVPHVRVIQPEELRPSTLFDVWNKSTLDLKIHRLEIHQLRRAHGWLWASARPLALLLLAVFGYRHRRLMARYFGSARRTGSARRFHICDAVLAAVLFVVCFHLFLWAPVQQVIDAKFSTVVGHRLITGASLSIPDHFSIAKLDPLPYQLQLVGNEIYHFYPDAVAVLNAPYVAIFSWLGIEPVTDGGLYLRQNENRILVVAAASQAAATCALFFLLGRLYVGPGMALALSGVFAFGTQIYSSVSRSYWSHAWALLLLTGALYVLLKPKLKRSKWWQATGATLLSWSFFCRPPMSLAILGLSVYLVATRRRHLTVFVATGLVWAALFVAYSLAVFGQPIPPYFLTRHLETGVLGVETLRASYPTALGGTLFSPSRGLFIYVPFLVPILFLTVRHWARLADRALAATALAVCFAHWHLLSASRAWSGGQSFGPRLFADILVWFFLLAVLVLPVEWKRLRGQSSFLVWIKAALAVLLIGVSLFINFRGSHSTETIRWRGYSFWDWRHPQFLAGLFPEPRKKTLAERVVNLKRRPDAVERARVLHDIEREAKLPKRWVDPERILAIFVTWDKWTYGEAPAALVVINDDKAELAPRLRLATWASAADYPITVHLDDGQRLRSLVIGGPGFHDVELTPLPPLTRRLVLVWSDKAWIPAGSDSRRLGVQLLAPE